MDISVKFHESGGSFRVDAFHSGESFETAFGTFVTITTEVPVPGSDVEVYEGAYTVTPKVEAQTLLTANKFLQDDVSVHGVPFYEVSNTSGGNTVYIASEVI